MQAPRALPAPLATAILLVLPAAGAHAAPLGASALPPGSACAALFAAIAAFAAALVWEWNDVANHLRLASRSLADVERTHPRLPRRREVAAAVALSLALAVLCVELAERAYAMGFLPAALTAETKNTVDVVLFDMDGDNDLDFVAGNADSDDAARWDVYRNDGGAFTHAGLAGRSESFLHFAAGDVDRDGDIDLVATFASPSPGRLALYRNDGGGTFSLAYSQVAPGVGDIRLADVDLDGDLDAVTCSAVFLNSGTGDLVQSSSLTACETVSVADFTGDGYPDAALGTADGFLIYVNSGTGAAPDFSGAIPQTDGPEVAVGHHPVPADLDGDGDIDLAMVRDSLPFEQFRAWANDGHGHFTAVSPAYGSRRSYGAAGLGDLDNDGDVDVLLAGRDPALSGAGGTEPWLNDGTAAAFSPGEPAAMDGGDCRNAVALGDVDLDGDVDYVAANDDPACTGAGGVNRIHLNDQALSLANLPPSPPADGEYRATASRSATGVTADLVLEWGSGTDAISPTRQLQYRVRVGTAPGAADVVSPAVGSPAYTDRLVPSGQNRRRLIRNLPCGRAYFWAVAAVDTGLHVGPFSPEQTITLDAACAARSADAVPAGGGGGVGYWLKGGQSGPTPEQAEPAGTVGGQLFVDVNANGKREQSERGAFAGARVTATGKDTNGTDVTRSTIAGKAGAFSFMLPTGTYGLSVEDPGGVISGFAATSHGAEDIVVATGATVTADFGWRSTRLVGYKPCLSIGEVDVSGGKTVAEGVMAGLKTLYGKTAATPSTGVLVKRKEFVRMLAQTQCVHLSKAGDDLRETLRGAAKTEGWKQAVLADVPVPERLQDDWQSSAYALLAHGVPVGRSSGEGLVADAEAFVTRREAMSMVKAVLGVEAEAEDAALPPDATEDDKAVGTFAALNKAGVLPRGFEAAMGGGVTPREVAELLVKAAFAGGKIPLGMIPDEEHWDQTAVQEYLASAGYLEGRDCLVQDMARAEAVHADVLPNAPGFLYERLKLLLTLGTKDAEGRTRYLITGRPSEYGVKAGTVGLSAGKAVTWVALADIGMKLTCHPLETYQSAVTRLSGGGVNVSAGGTANMIFAPDRLFGTADDTTYVSRLLHSFQRPIREFDLTPLAFAQDLTLQAQRDFASSVSEADASRLLASYVLYTRVKSGAMSRLEAEGTFAELQNAILLKLTGLSQEEAWRLSGMANGKALTWGQLIEVLSDVLGPETGDDPLPALPEAEAWWGAVGGG